MPRPINRLSKAGSMVRCQQGRSKFVALGLGSTQRPEGGASDMVTCGQFLLIQHCELVVSFPDPAPLRGKESLGTLVDFLGILCVSNHVTHAYAHAHFSNKRVIRELRIVSCPGGGVWVAVTHEFERDNCVTS